ncbi:hypothetical protein VTN77DRAFT_3978 [Rasamsonia byssochlamydoides]|uniref:uncharacterized protein n=1 Tax=Rasamsonia byssochlamydoides TaxID=89139 RepID=UPI003742E195
MQTTGDPSQSSGQSNEALTAQQFAQRATYNYVNAYSGHEILARMRLIPNLGGTGAAVNVSILNDTGSTIQSVLQTDLAAMGLNPQYGGLGPPVVVQTANGPVNRQSIFVELQLMRADGTVASEWIRELGLITPPGAAQMRLTGAQGISIFTLQKRKTALCQSFQFFEDPSKVPSKSHPQKCNCMKTPTPSGTGGMTVSI